MSRMMRENQRCSVRIDDRVCRSTSEVWHERSLVG